MLDFVDLCTEVLEVSAADVGLGAHGQAGDFLTKAEFLQASFLGADDEMAFRDDAS